MNHATRAMFSALLLIGAPLAGPAAAAPQTMQDEKGRTIAIPLPVEQPFRSAPWPAHLEEAFQERMNHALGLTMQMRLSGANTYFENEKRAYGHLMMQILGGREEAIRHLQAEDAQARDWHRHTLGIDWYACFTIKHQIRKYFYFGDLLDPIYRQRMHDSARIWTEQDPLRRPHHAYTPGRSGYGPDARNSWVDTRSTDNLWWMRVCAVYLMAEETGNEATRQIYKSQIRDHVTALYRIGMGEWDSENYLGHSITPVLGLYDFAKDPQVKKLAKAALDWMFASAAVKYWRGGFNGPTKRDYNHPYPLGGSAAAMGWVYFGQYPGRHTHLESDEVHAWTSAYRPPLAIVNLAHRKFDRPVELFAAKPPYEASKSGKLDVEPAELETHYFGHTFQFGTLAFGTGRADVNGFKILTHSSEDGADYIVAAPTDDPLITGSPQYRSGVIEPNRIAHFRNIAIWLVEKPDAPWRMVLPKSVEVEKQDSALFLKAEKTWIAIHPINLSIAGIDAEETAKVNYRLDRTGQRQPLWPDMQVITAAGLGNTFCGFAIEIGEEQTHGDYAAFKSKVARSARLDLAMLFSGVAGYTASDGRGIRMKFGRSLDELKVWRDGELHGWEDHRAVYRQVGAPPERSIIHQAWGKDGALRISAGDSVFSCTVGRDGSVTFDE